MRRTRTGPLLAGLFAVATTGAVGADEVYRLFGASADRPADIMNYVPAGYPTPVIAKPPAVSADAAGLADDEPVVGLAAGGTARAYRRSALDHVHYHVVNDLVGGVPVTVTRCDRKQCTRVFTGDGGRTLGVRVAGYLNGLILKVGGQTYRQDDGTATGGSAAGPLPLRPFLFVEATWREWRTAHPDTDVVLGGEPTPARWAAGG